VKSVKKLFSGGGGKKGRSGEGKNLGKSGGGFFLLKNSGGNLKRRWNPEGTWGRGLRWVQLHEVAKICDWGIRAKNCVVEKLGVK